MDESQTSHLNDVFSTLGLSEISFPPSLKFILNNIARIVPTSLSGDNYPLWQSQVLKLLRANDFEGFLDGSTVCPPQFHSSPSGQQRPNPAYRTWKLLDQNLCSALCSTITAYILPYVIHLESTNAVWLTLERRLQATNRARIIQLKNELHTISMKDQTLTQYLTQIKTIADNLTTAGAPLDSVDIILYTLNGLPSQFQGFKTVIQNSLHPISLDDFYSLIHSEDIQLTKDNSHSTLPATDSNTALYASRGRGRSSFTRGRGRWNSFSRHGGASPSSSKSSPPVCQICTKVGHTAIQCWH